jgi:chromosome segregation ATPase
MSQDASMRFTADIDVTSMISNLKSLEQQLQNSQNFINQFGSSFDQSVASLTQYEESLESITATSGQVSQSIESLGTASQQAAGSLEQIAQANTSASQSLESIAQSGSSASQTFDQLSVSVDGLGAPFQTVAQSVTEFNTVLDSTGQAVTTFEATSTTLSDTLTTSQTAFTDLQTTTQSYSDTITTLEPSIRQLDAASIEHQGSLTTSNTLVQDISLSTETYTGALGNLGTSIQETTTKTQEAQSQNTSFKESLLGLGTSITSLVAMGYNLYVSWDNMEKAALRTEKSSVALDRALQGIENKQQALATAMEKGNVVSASAQQAYDNLSTAITEYTSLLDQNITSGTEYETALANVQIAQAALRQELIDSGLSITEVDTLINQLTISLETGYVRSATEARNITAEQRAEFSFYLNLVGTATSIIQGVVASINLYKEVSVSAGQAIQTFSTAVRAGSIAVGAFTVSIQTLLIATGVGIAIFAITEAFILFKQKGEEAKVASDALSEESLPELGTTATTAATGVDTLKNKAIDFVDAARNMKVAAEDLKKPMEDIANVTIPQVARSGQGGTQATGQGEQQLVIRQKENQILTELTRNYENVGIAGTRYGEVLQTLGTYGEQMYQIHYNNSLAMVNENESAKLLTAQQRESIATVDASLKTVRDEIQSRIEGRRVRLEDVQSFLEWSSSVDMGTVSTEQLNKKMNELFPTYASLDQAADKQLQTLKKENDGLVEQARYWGATKAEADKFKVTIDETTGTIEQSSSQINTLNGDLYNLAAQHIDVTKSVTDSTLQHKLMGEGVYEAKQKVEQFGESLIKNKSYNDELIKSYQALADSYKLQLDPSLEKTEENYQLLLNTTDKSKESAIAYAKALLNEVAPAFEQLVQVGQNLNSGFADLATQWDENKKEIKKLIDFLPHDLEKQMKINLKAQVEVEEAKKELETAIKLLVGYKSDTFEYVLRPGIEFDASTAEKAIDALMEQISTIIEGNPLEAAAWQPLFNQLEVASGLKGQDAINAIEKILTDPKNVALLSGATTTLGEKGIGDSLLAALDAMGVKVPENIRQAILNSEKPAETASTQVGTKSADTTAKAIEENEKLAKAVSTVLGSEGTMINLADAGKKGGEKYADSWISAAMNKFDNSSMFGGIQKSQDEKYEFPTTSPFDVRPTGDTKQPVTQAATLGGDYAKEYDAVIQSASKMSAQVQLIFAGIATRAGIEFAKIPTAFTTAMTTLQTSATTVSAQIQTIFTGIPARAGIEFAKIPALFTTAMTSLNSAAGTTSGQIQLVFAGIATRAGLEAGKIAPFFVTAFTTIRTNITTASAQIQQIFTGISARAVIEATKISESFTTQFQTIRTTVTQASAQIQQMLTGITSRAVIENGKVATSFTETWTEIKETVTTTSAEIQQMLTGITSRVEIENNAQVEDWTTTWETDIVKTVTTASGTIQTIIAGLRERAELELGKISNAFETEGKKWEETVQKHVTAMANMFGDLLPVVEDVVRRINDELDKIEDEEVVITYTEKGKPKDMQFGTDEIIEPGQFKTYRVGDANRQERVRISPAGTAGFSGADDFTSQGAQSNMPATRVVESSRNQFGENIPVNVTIIENSHTYLDSELLARKVNKKVYKGISGTMG